MSESCCRVPKQHVLRGPVLYQRQHRLANVFAKTNLYQNDLAVYAATDSKNLHMTDMTVCPQAAGTHSGAAYKVPGSDLPAVSFDEPLTGFINSDS